MNALRVEVVLPLPIAPVRLVPERVALLLVLREAVDADFGLLLLVFELLFDLLECDDDFRLAISSSDSKLDAQTAK